MNVALLSKWIWKLSQNESGLWADLLKAKYFPNGTFFESFARGSPFWNGIQKIKPAFAMGAKFQLHDGKSIKFWIDSWVEEQPLWMEFQSLYALAVDPNITVAEALSVSPPAIPFHHELSVVARVSWDRLLLKVPPFSLSAGPDQVSWHLASSGNFLVHQGPRVRHGEGFVESPHPPKN